MSTEKYKLGEYYPYQGHRIVALKDFGPVKKGDLGGIIGNGVKLSHEGNAWVDRDSIVTGNVVIEGNVQIINSKISPHSKEESRIFGDAVISNCKFDSFTDYLNISGSATLESSSAREISVRKDDDVFLEVSGDSFISNSVLRGHNVIKDSVISNSAIEFSEISSSEVSQELLSDTKQPHSAVIGSKLSNVISKKCVIKDTQVSFGDKTVLKDTIIHNNHVITSNDLSSAR